MADEVVSAELKADSKSFVRAFNDAGDAVGNVVKAGKAMVSAYKFVGEQVRSITDKIVGEYKRIGIAALGAVASTALMARSAKNNFSSFQTSMANVSTVTDRANVSMDRMSTAVMKMTSTFPQSAEELASGLYEINSSGFQGAEALEMLGSVAKFSVAGVVDMGTAVRATTGIINAYNLSADDAEHVTNILFKAVEVGQMTATEFAMNIGDWAAAASSLKIPFESASAALATMTIKGILANQASTSLAGIMRALIRPSEGMTKALKRMGFENGKAALASEGFAGTLGALWEQAGKNETRFADIFQDTEAFKGALTLVANGFDELVESERAFNDGAQTANVTQRAFELQMSTLANKSALFRNELRQVGYEMGSVVAPMFNSFVGIGTSVINFFNGLPGPVKKVAAALMLMGPILTTIAGFMLLNMIRARAMIATYGMLATRTAALALSTGAYSLTLAAGIGRVGMFFQAIAAAGGPVKLLTIKLKAFAVANLSAQIAMLKTAAAAIAATAGVALLAYGVYSMVSSFKDADRAAQEFAGNMNRMANGGISSLEDLNSALQDVSREIDNLPEHDTGGNLWNSFKATAQVLTPFTENTILNAQATEKALQSLREEYLDFYSLATELALFNGQGIDMNLGALTDLDREGIIDLENVIKLQTEFDTLNEKQRNGENLSPEEINRWNTLWAALKQASEATDEYIKKQEQIATANAAGSAAAVDFELAMLAIGDAASTARDKLDAYKTIIDQLLGAPMDLRDQQAALLKTMEDLGRVMIDEGANFDLYTEGGRSLQGAFSSANEAVRTLMSGILEQTGSMDQATVAGAQYVQGLIALAQNAGWSEEQIATMVSTMGLTPEVLETLVTLPGIDPAISNLLTTAGLLTGLDGFVAQAGVNITITAGTAVGPQKGGPNSEGFGWSYDDPALNGNPTADISSQINDFIKGIKGNIPAGKSGGGGGGGGGGGADKWKPTATQLKNMKAALAAPLTNLLSGDLGDVWQKQMINNWVDATNKNIMTEGASRIGARIIQEAQASGTDPAAEFDKLFEAYKELEEVTDKATADAAMNMFDTLQQFEEYVDSVVELIQHQQDIEDWKYDRSEINFADYKALLLKRLAAEEEFSDEWMRIQDQLDGVEEDRLREERRMMDVRLALEEITQTEYMNYLMQRLVAYEQYSEEWFDIWQEINDAEQAALDEQDNKVLAIQDFAAAVKDAFDDIKKSVSDPMLQATSLVANFGQQASITKDQLEGYYAHMMEGTQRWVTAIKELKARGVNAAFLNELISAGPQSVAFAESVLALGPDGITFINGAMGDIAALADDLGTNIAQGSVGPVTNIDNSLSIQVGDITITGEMPGGVTIDEVTEAIEDALAGVAAGVANRQPRIDPPVGPMPQPRPNAPVR